MEWFNKYIVNGFFGWENFKWILRELLKVGSNQPSFFSKKRVESGTAFGILQFGMLEILAYLLSKETAMSDFVMWAGIEAFICGYALNKIQSEKLNGKDEPKTDS